MDKIPPLPVGASYEPPPLPAGASYVQNTSPYAGNDVPTFLINDAGKPSAPQEPNKLIQFLSGGKSNNLQQYIYNNEQPAESTIGKVGQLMEGSDALMGIPVLGQVGPVFSYGAAKAPMVASAVSKVGQKLSELPLSAQSLISGKPKEEIRAMYNIGKEKSGDLLNQFKKWANNDLKVTNRGDYNTAIAEGVPHEIAIQATHRRQDLPEGVWYLKNLYNNNFVPEMNITLEQFARQREVLMNQVLPKATSEAQRLGMKYGDYIPTNLKDLANLGAHSAGWGGLGSMLAHSIAGVKAAGIPFIVKSPKLNADIAIGAGKAARAAESGYDLAKPALSLFDNITTPQAIGLLGQVVQQEVPMRNKLLQDQSNQTVNTQKKLLDFIHSL